MGELRSFCNLTNAAPINASIFVDRQGPSQGSPILRPILWPTTLIDVDGYAAASGWFQIFDMSVAPTSTSTVPLKSFNVAAAGPLPSIFQQIGGIPIRLGLWFAMSSTEAVYTAVGTNFDVFGEIENYEQQPDGTSVIGDLTTGVDSLNVTSLLGRTLVQVDIINGLGAGVYGQVFAKISPSSGVDKPVLQFPLGSGTTAQMFRFGTTGVAPFSQDSNLTQRRQIAVAVSTTSGLFTSAGTTLNKIRALFKNV